MKLVRGASSAYLEHGWRAQRRRQLLALEYDVEAWGRRPLDRFSGTLARRALERHELHEGGVLRAWSGPLVRPGGSTSVSAGFDRSAVGG